MYKYTRYTDPRNYRHLIEDLENLPTYEVSPYAVREGEVIKHTSKPYNTTPCEEILAGLDDVDTAIVVEVARSYCLTAVQIYEFLRLRGFDVERGDIRSRLYMLMRQRLLQENKIKAPDADTGLRYYILDVYGYQLALAQFVAFHAGNRYLSYRKREEAGRLDTPELIKRILAGNQIVLGLLRGNAHVNRFGINESFYVECESGDDIAGCIIGTTAEIRVDNDSVLAYEVIRDSDEAYAAIADKVRRYQRILHNERYVERNAHGDTCLPQLVICGESLEHSSRIAAYLDQEGLLNDEDTILFTDDMLHTRGDSLESVYEFTRDGRIQWYRLPAANTRTETACAPE